VATPAIDPFAVIGGTTDPLGGITAAQNPFLNPVSVPDITPDPVTSDSVPVVPTQPDTIDVTPPAAVSPPAADATTQVASLSPPVEPVPVATVVPTPPVTGVSAGGGGL
jgi:hypothetical protein